MNRRTLRTSTQAPAHFVHLRTVRRFAVLAIWLMVFARIDAQEPTPQLRWGGDAEGGAPYVEADPSNPRTVVGYEVEIAQLLAVGLGRTPRFIQTGFASLEASVARGDFDIVLDGIEDTPARRARLAVTIPYHQFREVLTVRQADVARFRTLAYLRGRRVATLSATLAYELLTKAQAESGLIPITYDDDVHPYSDLALGRIDAVLLDDVIAARRVPQNPGLVSQATEVGSGYYVGVLAPSNTALRDRIDQILKQAMRDGRLEAIFRKWQMWNDDQPRLYARVTGGPVDVTGDAATSNATTATGQWEAVRRYLPGLLGAALITLGLSCVSMALAVAAGVVVASGRVYGPKPARLALTAWVEMIRGTPLLLQLFVLYYGLATVVELPAMFAAFLGLGLNYAAYESEIYRGALEAIPQGQLDAARALGFSERQTLVLIRGPQAFRLALPAMTNDFVALLKDSSLVSVITVVELTKQTSIFANNIGSWVVPGAVCAVLYLGLSLPIAHAARRLENGWGRKLV